MTETMPNFDRTLKYFQERLDQFGTTPRGVDWNSEGAQETRFAQLVKVCSQSEPFSLLDYGSGYGALARYLIENGYPLREYVGYDILEGMVEKGRGLYAGSGFARFTSKVEELTPVDYGVASGIFNIRLDASFEEWTRYVESVLRQLNALCRRGFSFNGLTKYSDPEYMKPHLYYADPCHFFDYCKRYFSRNVALLHDYDLYDFTIVVRKQG